MREWRFGGRGAPASEIRVTDDGSRTVSVDDGSSVVHYVKDRLGRPVIQRLASGDPSHRPVAVGCVARAAEAGDASHVIVSPCEDADLHAWYLSMGFVEDPWSLRARLAESEHDCLSPEERASAVYLVGEPRQVAEACSRDWESRWTLLHHGPRAAPAAQEHGSLLTRPLRSPGAAPSARRDGPARWRLPG